MFSEYVSIAAFAITSVIIVLLILDAILNRKENDFFYKIKPYTYWNIRTYIIASVWFASGFYLWG
jgi:hypothetical protein